MNESEYIEHFNNSYCGKVSPNLDENFVIPLPSADGITKTGEFLVQGEAAGTVSVNVICTYQNDTRDVKITEVYKNTQHTDTGVYVRLVGTMSILLRGYPMVFLDAAVSNVSPLTARREPVTTRIAVHMPQSTMEQRSAVFGALDTVDCGARASVSRISPDTLPDFWGPLWLVQNEGLHIDMIRTVRDALWAAYHQMSETTQRERCDYRMVQEHMINDHAESEHRLFQRMGLTVPVEAQAAFFSILSSDL